MKKLPIIERSTGVCPRCGKRPIYKYIEDQIAYFCLNCGWSEVDDCSL